MAYKTELQSNNTDLQAILATINELPETVEQATPEISVSSNGLITATAGTKTSTHQLAFQAAKTITPSTTSQIAVSSGYYTGGNITVAAVPTQSKTVTPTTATQNVNPDSGKFLSRVTVNAIPSSYVIPSGTLTISTNGTHDVTNYASAVVEVESSGSGEAAEWSEAEDAMVTGTLSEYTNSRVTSIGNGAFMGNANLVTVSFPKCIIINGYNGTGTMYIGAFYNCSKLTSVFFPTCTSIGNLAFCQCTNLRTVSFPACKSIGKRAFEECSKLTTVSFPACTNIDSSAFYDCSNLTSVSFPVCTSINMYAFRHCSRLTSISLPVCSYISANAFSDCYNLSSLNLGASTVCTLTNSDAFSRTPYAGYSSYFSGTPYIYVPSSLVASYQAATNWTYFSSYIVGGASLDGGDAGNGGSSGENNIISFTIDGVSYQAEEGMTFGEWVSSSYNVDGWTVMGDTIMLNGPSFIKVSTVIEDGASYESF